jgi:hypothetical protein
MNTSSAVAECVERDAREKFSAWAAVLGAPAVPARYFIALPFRIADEMIEIANDPCVWVENQGGWKGG